MKNAKPFLIAVAIAASVLSGSLTGLHAAEFKLTGENTSVKFLGTKKDGKHNGAFPKLTGVFKYDGDVTKGNLQVTLDVNALTTDAPKLTAHLKAPDFFDAKRFPQAKFVSKNIKADGDHYMVSGDLTMHGKTAPLSFPAKIAVTGGTLTVSAQFDLNRNDWGISYGKGNVNDLVKMTIEVTAK